MNTFNSTIMPFADHGRADLRDVPEQVCDAAEPQADARSVFGVTMAIVVVTMLAVWFGA